MSTVLCGNASDSLYLTFKSGCRKDLPIEDAYRCTGCGGRFHKDCIPLHFKLEEAHDWGRQEERSAGQVAVIQARVDTAKQILAIYESGIIGTYKVNFAVWLSLYVTDLKGELAELEHLSGRQLEGGEVPDGTMLHFKGHVSLEDFGKAMKAYSNLIKSLEHRDTTYKEFTTYLLDAGYVEPEITEAQIAGIMEKAIADAGQ